jgi:hypothetical protein
MQKWNVVGRIWKKQLITSRGIFLILFYKIFLNVSVYWFVKLFFLWIFKCFFLVSPVNFLRRSSISSRFSNFRTRNSYSHQKELIVWRSRLSVERVEFRDSFRRDLLRSLYSIYIISMRRPLSSSSNCGLY